VHREPWVRYHSALSQILFLKDWGQFTKSDGPQCPNEKHIGEFRSVVLSQFGIAPQPSAVRGRACYLACTRLPLSWLRIHFHSWMCGLRPTVRIPTTVCQLLLVNAWAVSTCSSTAACDGLVALPFSGAWWAVQTCKDDLAKGGMTIMFIRRGNYQRRPGHSGGLDLRLGNEEEISQALHAWAGRRTGVTVVDARLEKMSMTEQLQLVHKSCIMVGAHGYVLHVRHSLTCCNGHCCCLAWC
jgi:hypothetical protein